jgi:hypothetical protein
MDDRRQSLGSRNIIRASATQNVETEHVGAANASTPSRHGGADF